jgi:hypothetical protein
MKYSELIVKSCAKYRFENDGGAIEIHQYWDGKQWQKPVCYQYLHDGAYEDLCKLLRLIKEASNLVELITREYNNENEEFNPLRNPLSYKENASVRTWLYPI